MKKDKIVMALFTLIIGASTLGLTGCWGGGGGGDNNNPNTPPIETPTPGPGENNGKVTVTIVFPQTIDNSTTKLHDDVANEVDKNTTYDAIKNSIPQITGYTLEGLYRSVSFEDKINLDSYITENVTIYARFERISAKITFVSNNTEYGTVEYGTVSQTSDISVVYGTQITINENEITIGSNKITATPKSGYVFDKWQFSNGKTETFTITTSDPITITAVFKRETFVVEVSDKDNLTNKIYSGDIERGTTIGELKTIILNKTGYNITEVMIGGNPVDDNYVIEKTELLTVSYSFNVNLTSTNGTLTHSSIALTPNSKFAVNKNVLTINGTPITATASEGYHFVEWKLNGGKINDETETSVAVTKETTIVAVFEINIYKVTIKDNLDKHNDIIEINNVEHGTTFGELKSQIPSEYNVVAAKLSNDTEVNDDTIITSDTIICITYSVSVSVGVVDSNNQPSENGTLDTTSVTINTGDVFTISGNTLTIGDTTITVSYASDYNLIKWMIGTTKIENGTIYDGTENTICVVIDNIKYEVSIDFTHVEETIQTSINEHLGENFSITESVSAGTTVKQLSDKLRKYGLTLSTVAFSGEYNDEDVIKINNDSTTAITDNRTIYVITCVFDPLFKYGDNSSSIAGLDDNYTSLEEVYIPVINNEKTIITSTFINYNNLKTIIFGGSAIIRSGAFSGCSIENIYVPSLEVWLNMGLSSELFPNGVNLYINNELVTDINITSGMTIGDYAFAGCNNIQNVTVCSDVTTVGASAFKNCTGLKTITFESSSNINISDNAFYGCSELTTLTGTLGTVGASAFENCTKLTSALTINGNIGNNGFKSCSSLTSVILSDSITEIAEYAFNWCQNLETINIPTSLTNLGEFAFEGCESITDIVLPGSLKVLNNGVFKDCAGLVNVTLSSQLQTIGGTCFQDCSSLESIVIPQSVTRINSNAFLGCGLNSVTFESYDGWKYANGSKNAGFSNDDLANNATLLMTPSRVYTKLA